MDSLAEWHLNDGGVIQISTTDPTVVASGRQRLVTCTDPAGNQLGLLEVNQ